jgi:hypothetical protein
MEGKLIIYGSNKKKYWTIYEWHMDETMTTEWKIHGK